MSILLIDDNAERRAQLELLLGFIDFDIYASTGYSGWQEVAQETPPEVVVVGECKDSNRVVSLIKSVKDTFDSMTPVLLLSELYDKSLLAPELANVIVNVI